MALSSGGKSLNMGAHKLGTGNAKGKPKNNGSAK